MANTMFIRNMNISRMPMSAWNWSAEKAHVPTPTESVRPVNTTALPTCVIVASIASANESPLRRCATKQLNK